MKSKFLVGQLLKNSPNDNEAFFKIIRIDELNGTYYYRVQCLYDNEMVLVLHDCDMFPLTFEEAKEYRNTIDEKLNIYSKELNKYNDHCNSIGLLPDHIRELPEMKEAKRQYNLYFQQLRTFNTWYTKYYKKEITIDRNNRFKKIS